MTPALVGHSLPSEKSRGLASVRLPLQYPAVAIASSVDLRRGDPPVVNRDQVPMQIDIGCHADGGLSDVFG
jgi:hypothetical protein